MVIVFAPLSSFGQGKSTNHKKTDLLLLEPDIFAPPVGDLVFVLNLYGGPTATLRIESVNRHDIDIKTVSALFDRLDPSAKPKQKQPALEPVIELNVNPALTVSSVLEQVETLRRPGNNRIRIKAGNGYLIIPALAIQRPPKPNPLILVVDLSETGAISLNGEQFGSITDLASLAGKLADVFNARKENGVIRRGTNQIDTTVLVKVNPARTYFDVENLVTHIRKAGSDRIVFCTDDLEKLYRFGHFAI